MVGLQYTSVKQQFGAKLNGIINYDFWIPAPTMQFPGILNFLKKYQAKAPGEGIDPLGWYLRPFRLRQPAGIGRCDRGDQEPRSDQARRLHPQPFVQHDRRRDRVWKDGERAKPRVLEVQFQDIQGTDH